MSIAFATGVCFLLAGVGLASIVVYKPYGVRDSQRAEYENILSDIRLKAELSRSKVTSELPTAFVPEAVHVFGNMAPHSSDTHQFRIQNTGSGPLTLDVVGTSCKCATGRLTKGIVPPGESTELEVTWNTGQPGEEYDQTVLLKTNDPEHPQIELTIQGEVYAELVAPEQVGFAKADLSDVVKSGFVIYSQLYKELSVVSCDCDLPGFEWSVEPASIEKMDLLHAETKSALNLSIQCKPAKRGEFTGTAKLTLINELGSMLERSITLSGKVRASINFYDSEIYMKSGLDMGTFTSGKRHEFAIVVRADEKDRDLEVLRVEPPEVKATIKRLGKNGAHRLLIYIPKDCPTVVFNLNSKRGYVEVGDPNDKSYSNWLPIYGAVAKAEL